MRCASCGAPLIAGARVCGVCGHPVPAPPPNAQEAHSARTPGGLPVGRYQPSSYGPPVRPDVLPRASEMEPEAPARRAFGYRPVDLPPPARTQHGSPVRTIFRFCLLLLLLGLLAAATAYVRGDLPLRNPFGHSGANGLPAGAVHTPGTSVSVTGTAPAAACPNVAVDTLAARALSHVQLTTGLRDAAAHDYRPVNGVSTFAAGQTGYVTFEVATGQAGTVGVLICTPTTRISGTLEVPGGSSGRYGEFAATFGPTDPGPGRLMLTWNGAVAANLSFTVTR